MCSHRFAANTTRNSHIFNVVWITPYTFERIHTVTSERPTEFFVYVSVSFRASTYRTHFYVSHCKWYCVYSSCFRRFLLVQLSCARLYFFKRIFVYFFGSLSQSHFCCIQILYDLNGLSLSCSEITLIIHVAAKITWIYSSFFFVAVVWRKKNECISSCGRIRSTVEFVAMCTKLIKQSVSCSLRRWRHADRVYLSAISSTIKNVLSSSLIFNIGGKNKLNVNSRSRLVLPSHLKYAD